MKTPLWLIGLTVIMVIINVGQPASAYAQHSPPNTLHPTVQLAEHYDTSIPLSQALPDVAKTGKTIYVPNKVLPKRVRDIKTLEEIKAQGDDTYAQFFAPQQDNALDLAARLPNMPAPIANFDGVNNLNAVSPPDPAGDIGYDPSNGRKYYVQWVNLSYAIWNVTDPASPILMLGPFNGNRFWQGFGTPCESENDGDPIVLFDQLAQRWLVSQFATPKPYYQCVAISASADPTGSWHRYAFKVSDTKFNDYAKFGVWPDGYYFSLNNFIGNSWAGTSVVALERNKMLSGQPAALIQFDLFDVNIDYSALLPSDLDGNTLPPAGAPNMFMSVDDNALTPGLGSVDMMRLWQFKVDWANPGNSTFGLGGNPNHLLPVAPFNLLPCAINGTRGCIPQRGGTSVDGIADRLMYRLAYRNFGTHQSLVVNHTVDVGSGRAGVRWYEVRDPAGLLPSIYQQGSYAPADGLHRWNASAAQDHVGNIALGYSASSSSVYASVRAAGRLFSDPLNQLDQGESVLVNGSGAQTISQRWGDYSLLNTDPVDDCTFWYTNEYFANNSANGWRTSISAFRFPNCGAEAPGTLTGTVRSSGNPLSSTLVTAQISANQAVQILTDASGTFELSLLPGSYTVTAALYGYLPSSLTSVSVTSNLTTSVELTLTSAPTHVVSGIVTSAANGNPLPASLVITGTPFSPPIATISTNDQTGAYSFVLAEGQSYTLSASALLHTPQARGLGVINSDQTQNFVLTATTNNGGVIGYVRDLATQLPITQAKVSLAPNNLDTLTDDNGAFQFVNVPTGTYTLTAAYADFVTATLGAVSVQAASLTSRTLLLDRPRLDISPLTLSRTLIFGANAVDSAGLKVRNLGNPVLSYKLREVRGDGSAPDGGPDAFGYTWRASVQPDGPTFSWIDASDGISLSLGDDSETSINLPFAFPFYGQSSNQIQVGNNGALLFDSFNEVLPSNTRMSAAATNTIAVLWDDIDGGAGGVFWKVLGTAPTRRAVISWQDRPRFKNIGAGSFQVILYEDGDLLMQYKDVIFGSPNYDNGQSATIGIHSNSAANSLEYLYNDGNLMDGTAVCFDNPNSADACGQAQDAIPWLSLVPISATLNLSQTNNTALTWNAAPSAIAQPGEFHGNIIASSNDPWARQVVIPITLTVLPAPTQGLVSGTLTSTGVCDIAPASLGNANVLIQSNGLSATIRTDDNGRYQYYAEASVYTLTASATDHLSTQAMINVNSGMTVTQDFTLRLNKPCMTISPASISQTLVYPSSSSSEVLITSSGAQALNTQMALVPRGSRISLPDAQGYLLMPTSFEFIDISQTGTRLTITEDSATHVSVSFPLTLYGVTSTALHVGENGAVIFGALNGEVSYANTHMVNAPSFLVAPLWDDLDASTGAVYSKEMGSAPNRRFIIMWKDRAHTTGIGSATFEIIFEENGDIRFSYKDTDFDNTLFDFGASATIGVRGSTASEVVEYAFNESVLPISTTLCFTQVYARCNAVPWIVPTPTQVNGLSGTPSSTQTVQAELRSNQVGYGVHQADLIVINNSPEPLVRVPVTLTVTLPNQVQPQFLPIVGRF